MNNQINRKQNGNFAQAQKKKQRQKPLRPSQQSKLPARRQGPRVSAPLAQMRIMKTNLPSVSGSPYSGDGRTVFKHREYVADVNGSVAFAVNSYSVNPGLSSLFTWLAPIAAQFESYLFAKLSFEFESQKSASTNGSVFLAMDFDASDAAPANKQQLMAYHNAVRSAVWAECSYRADLQDLKKFGPQRYVRSGAAAANQDIKTFDVGNLLVGTQGCADATAIGELYVTYEVTLITPQSDPNAVSNAGAAKIVGGGTVSKTAVFGTAAVITGGLPVTALTNTLTFNRVGQYLLEQLVVGTTFTNVDATWTGTAASQTSIVQSYQSAAATGAVSSRLVTINNIGETVIADWSAVCTTLTSSTLRIAAYPAALA